MLYRDIVLIVDDMAMNREILTDILEEDHRVLAVENGLQAVETILDKKDRIAAILLDLHMPVMDGYEVLKWLNEHDLIESIPVLIISTEDSTSTARECFGLGITGYIHKPFDRSIVKMRVNNTASLYIYKQFLEDRVDTQTKILRKRNTRMLSVIASLVETRDLESGTHVQRVKDYTRILAKGLEQNFNDKYQLTPHSIDIIVEASVLHDVGKIAIPDSILLKPGRLLPEEFELMKTHTSKGAEFLTGLRDLWDADLGRTGYEIAMFHHEKYDGHGYPMGLSGDDIPISAQIVSIADVYDALVAERCYKPAYSKAEAYRMIMNGECGQFNPDLLECFTENIEEFERLAD